MVVAAALRLTSCWIGRWRRSTAVIGHRDGVGRAGAGRRQANADAEDLLAAPSDPGEIRRLTIFFADLVDSTVLSTRVEPETYRLLVGRYRELVLRAVNRYEGHIGRTAGDGLLAVFGHPIAHEDDVRRAVLAGLEITREVARLSEQARAPLRDRDPRPGWGAPRAGVSGHRPRRRLRVGRQSGCPGLGTGATGRGGGLRCSRDVDTQRL